MIRRRPAAPEAESDDSELFERFRRDPPAWMEAVYDRFAPLVYGIARAALGDESEAEDLTHEVFIGMLTRCEFDPARGTPSAYLTTLTRSRAIDRMRSRGRSFRVLSRARELGIAEPAASPDPQREVVLDQGRRRVRLSLERLPERQREVIELAYFKGMSQSEIAASLGAPLGSVKDWTRRALFAMRRERGDLVD